MRNFLTTIVVALLTSIASLYCLFNFIPSNILTLHKEGQFGASIQTINGSDTLSSSRTVINTNFSNLNTAKIEISDLSGTTSLKQLTTLANLSTVGTITSGTWNATTLTVPFGGTGSTTLSSFQVLLGNGTGGVTVPAGYGSSGQFLTSAGAGAKPTWTSGAIDTSLSYNWTGTNLFKNFNASGTIANPLVINGGSFTFPGSNWNSSTSTATSTLTQDGFGNITFTGRSFLLATSTTQINVNTTTSSTTLMSITVPAYALGTGNVLQVAIPVNSFAIQGTDSVSICLLYGSTQSICDLNVAGPNATNNAAGFIYLTLMSSGYQSQRMRYDFNLTSQQQLTGSGGPINVWTSNRSTNTTVDSTLPQTLTFSIKFTSSNANDRILTDGYFAQILH